jgi:hypothetical protein
MQQGPRTTQKIPHFYRPLLFDPFGEQWLQSVLPVLTIRTVYFPHTEHVCILYDSKNTESLFP